MDFLRLIGPTHLPSQALKITSTGIAIIVKSFIRAESRVIEYKNAKFRKRYRVHEAERMVVAYAA